MKIAFLIINYMPHQLVSIQTVINNYQVKVHAFSFKDNTPVPDNVENLVTYRLKDFSRAAFLNKLIEINPDIMVVAGWAVPDFVWAAKQVRKKLNIPVVSYSDTQWRGTWKQKVNSLISPWHLKKAFSHIWVAGVYQYEYARKLGYAKKQIIYNSLSCDLNLFKHVSLEHKQNSYPKNFLFVGRFVPVKGLDLLIQAWNQIEDKKGWSLTLVGDGPLKNTLKDNDEVVLKPWMTHTELLAELSSAGCFILPSVFEPWALVIHEAAASGLPIIATNVCGAAPHFVINSYNGFVVNPDIKELKSSMLKIINLPDKELIKYSERSKILAQKITPELGSAQLLSVINTDIIQ